MRISPRWNDLKDIKDTTMRILFLTSEFGYGYGGWERYSRGVVSSARAFADVEVFVLRKKTGVEDPAVHEVLPEATFTLKTQIRVFRNVFRELRRGSYDVVHSLIEPYAPGAALASWICGVPFVMTLHGTYSVKPTGWGTTSIIRRILTPLTYRLATIVTTGSLGTEERVRKEMYLPECRFIPNGVDSDVFHQIPGCTKEPFIMTVGMLKPRKGADLGVRVLARLKERFPQLRYLLIGDLTNASFVNEVKSIAETEGISDRIEFLGEIPDSALADLYNRSVCMLLPAREAAGTFEGFPMVFYEANACGTPVVTTRGFGSEYAIKDGVNGYLTEQEDVTAMAERISQMLSDTDLYNTLVVGSLAEAHRHTWPMLIKTFQDFYQRAKDVKSEKT